MFLNFYEKFRSKFEDELCYKFVYVLLSLFFCSFIIFLYFYMYCFCAKKTSVYLVSANCILRAIFYMCDCKFGIGCY